MIRTVTTTPNQPDQQSTEDRILMLIASANTELANCVAEYSYSKPETLEKLQEKVKAGTAKIHLLLETLAVPGQEK